MFEAPEGIIFRPLSVRVRLREAGPEEAIATSGDGWTALELYFSDAGAAFLSGRIKRVANALNLKNTNIIMSYSLVHTQAAERAAVASRHRAALLAELAKQYRDALARTIGGGAKAIKHRRQRANAALGAAVAEPAAVAAYYSDKPEALAACQPIYDLWSRINGGEDW